MDVIRWVTFQFKVTRRVISCMQTKLRNSRMVWRFYLFLIWWIVCFLLTKFYPINFKLSGKIKLPKRNFAKGRNLNRHHIYTSKPWSQMNTKIVFYSAHNEFHFFPSPLRSGEIIEYKLNWHIRVTWSPAHPFIFSVSKSLPVFWRNQPYELNSLRLCYACCRTSSYKTVCKKVIFFKTKSLAQFFFYKHQALFANFWQQNWSA